MEGRLIISKVRKMENLKHAHTQTTWGEKVTKFPCRREKSFNSDNDC